MIAHVLTGSKQEIAESLARIDGDVREAIVFVEEPSAPAADANEDIFAEMAPYTVDVGDADCSRESIYTRMEGE
jgi:hypothetical protein